MIIVSHGSRTLEPHPQRLMAHAHPRLQMHDVMTDEYKVIVEQELLKQKEARSKTKLHYYTLDEFGLSDVSKLPFVKKYHEESRVLLEERRIF